MKNQSEKSKIANGVVLLFGLLDEVVLLFGKHTDPLLRVLQVVMVALNCMNHELQLFRRSVRSERNFCRGTIKRGTTESLAFVVC